jgi:sugar phosphate isomerase/epimerase
MNTTLLIARPKSLMMKRPYDIGATVRSDDPSTFAGLTRLHTLGAIGHIQLMLIPEHDSSIAQRRLENIESAGIPIIIHAPHHGQGVNPCAPAAFEQRSEQEMSRWIEHAMEQTFEAADVLHSPLIVLHAGRYEEGKKEEAISRFGEFLTEYPDTRLIVENLPEVYGGYHLLGSTADECVRITKERCSGYCLDFAHLYCTANYFGRPYQDLLEGFASLPVRLFHLSNTEQGSITDRHLELDHPDGGIDFGAVIRTVQRHLDIPVTLEYKYNDSRVYERQLQVFDSLYRRFREK